MFHSLDGTNVTIYFPHVQTTHPYVMLSNLEFWQICAITSNINIILPGDTKTPLSGNIHTKCHESSNLEVIPHTAPCFLIILNVELNNLTSI